VRKFRSGKETRTAEKNRHSSMSLGRLSRPAQRGRTESSLGDYPGEGGAAASRGDRKGHFGAIGRAAN